MRSTRSSQRRKTAASAAGKRSQSATEAQDVFATRPNAILKTPKACKSLLGRSLHAAVPIWQTNDCTGYLCDRLVRSNTESILNRIHDDNPIVSEVMRMVHIERLTCAISKSVTVSSIASGSGEAKERAKFLRGHARSVVKHIHLFKALSAEVDNWILNSKLVRSKLKHREETPLERNARLQSFWGLFHESFARKELNVRIGQHEPAQVVSRGPAGGDGPIFKPPASWENQGYFPLSRTEPSRPHSSASSRSGGVRVDAMQHQPAEEAPSWKRRPSRSRCSFGRWTWQPELSENASPAMSNRQHSPTSATTSCVSRKESWRSRPLPSAASEEKGRLSRLMDPAHLGLSKFLTPCHLRVSTLDRGYSLPDLSHVAGSTAGGIRGRSSVASVGGGGDRFCGTLPSIGTTALPSGVERDSGGFDGCELTPRFALKQPWRAGEAAAMRSNASPTGKYLHVCSESAIVPGLLPFITGHSSKLNAAGKDLVDTDLEAVTVMLRGVRVDEVDLSGNSLLTERSVGPFLESLLGMPASANLKRLGLGRCGGIGAMAFGTLVKLLSEPVLGAQHLQHLDMSGIRISMQSQLPFCRLLRQHPELQSLRLADTAIAIGRDGMLCITEVLNSTTITDLDLSWNCFTSEVFEKLGEQLVVMETLTSLSVANCSAATHGMSRGETVPKEDGTPIVFFIECLSKSRALTRLDLAMNRIDFQAALVIEDALEGNSVLKDLDVSYNPIGSHGLRALLRLLSSGTSGLVYLECENGFQDQPGQPSDEFVYNSTNPSGKYTLDLERPTARALLRKLYKACERMCLAPEAAFFEVVSKPLYVHAQKDETGLWIVPQVGTLSMRFSIEKLHEGALKNVEDSDFQGFIDRLLQVCRQQPSFRKAAPLFAIYRGLTTTQEQEAVIDALSKEFLLTYAQLRLLCSSREITCEAVPITLPYITGGDSARALAVKLTYTAGDLVCVLRRSRNFLRFNVENPTGHYILDLSNSGDFAVAQRLLMLDRWEAGVAARRQLVDISQRGNRSRLRNERYQGRPLPVESVAEWHMPACDILQLDYCTMRRIGKEEEPLSEVAFCEIVSALEESECRALHRVEALRAISHRFFVTCLQVRELLGVLRDAAARAELIVTLYFRIVDIYNEKLFRVLFEDERQVFELQHRLGYVTFFPFIQPESMQFELDLAFHDQRVATNLLVILCGKERHENLRDSSLKYSDGTVDELPMGVPRSWESLDKVPCSGLFRTLCVCAPETMKFQSRKQNLETYGFWTLPAEETDVIWWSGLVGIPPDVVEFILYLSRRHPTIDAGYKQFESGDGNGINCNDFVAKAQDTKCGKFKNWDKDRWKDIFQFLDLSGDGLISVQEWGVLSSVWCEIRLSLHFFAKFVNRWFSEDFDEAWKFFNVKGTDTISAARWADGCNAAGYFGPTKPIFAYLDKDSNDIVDQAEFLHLKDYLSLPAITAT